MSSGGRNGIGGAGITFAIVESSSGAASASAMNAGDHVGRRRQEQHPADHRVDGMEPELEPGDDTEVAAAATDRPEQIRLRLGVHPSHTTVGGHDVGGQQVVDREAVLPDEEPDPTAERDPADPHRAGVAEPRGEPMGSGGRGVLRRGETGADPRGAFLDVDVERSQIRQIELNAAIGAAVAGTAVAAAPNGDLQAGILRERDRPDDVLLAAGPDDGRRAEVVSAVEHRPGLVVPGVARDDDAAVESGVEPGDGRGCRTHHALLPSRSVRGRPGTGTSERTRERRHADAGRVVRVRRVDETPSGLGSRALRASGSLQAVTATRLAVAFAFFAGLAGAAQAAIAGAFGRRIGSVQAAAFGTVLAAAILVLLAVALGRGGGIAAGDPSASLALDRPAFSGRRSCSRSRSLRR